MSNEARWAILDSAPQADEALIVEHFSAFIDVFVQKSRRERWHYLLQRPNNPKKWRNLPNKLENHLDSERCTYVEYSNIEIACDNFINTVPNKATDMGVYFDLTNPPLVLCIADAFTVGAGDDAFFSLIPGKIAVYFNSDSFL